MRTTNAAALVKLTRDGRHLKICLFSNPGPFPFELPGTMGRAQYIGIAQHMVLTLMEDRYLPGLLAFQADCPMTPSGHDIHWSGGVSCQPYLGDCWYRIHTLFIRDVDQLLGQAKDLQLGAHVTGINGAVSNRQYWLVEIPSLTREVLLAMDEIQIVRKRGNYLPHSSMSSKVVRGEFWQCAGFVEHPAYGSRRGENVPT